MAAALGKQFFDHVGQLSGDQRPTRAGDLIALSVVRLNAGDRISTPIFEKFARQFDFDAATSPDALIRQMRTARASSRRKFKTLMTFLKLKYVNSPFLDPMLDSS